MKFVARIYLKLAALAMATGALTRIVLLFNSQTTDIGFSAGEWLEVFLLGAVNDLCAITLGFVFMMLFTASISDAKYRKPYGYL
ncbi:MAG: LTA synthase family protein, partial [Alistipes sp.]|nr:LTA synthase family protein [Alistipes sp.]